MRIMTFFSKLKKRERGVLLVDALIGVVILAVGLVALMQLFIYGTKNRADADLRQKAVQIAAEGIEKMKNVEAGTTVKITDYTDAADDIGTEIKLTDNEKFYPKVTAVQFTTDKATYKGDSNLVLVTSTVKWPENQSNSLTLYTYVTVTD